MKLTVERSPLPNCTPGKLFVDGKFFCYTLEDVDRKLECNPTGKIYGETAIPRGTYPVVLDFSNRFKQVMPHVLGVPYFDGIRIHAGNTTADTHGCLLVGEIASKDKVLESRKAYQRLMIVLEDALDRGEKLEIEYK